MNIYPLITDRMSLEMTELTVKQALDVSVVPVALYESQITKFLRYCVTKAKGVDADPINWTVQERYLAVSHYLSCSHAEDDGDDGYNFAIGNDAHYLDYFDVTQNSLADTVLLGVVGDDEWNIRQLTGVMTEAIEATLGRVDCSKTIHILFGTVAAQLFITGEKTPEFELEAQLHDWLVSRIETFLAYPEGDFCALLGLFYYGKEQLKHFFDVRTSQDGFIVLPKKEVSGFDPTRFLANTCITRTIRDLSRLP